MPCSCGNTTCPCGIPCCCSEESCKCDACAISIQRTCKICNKLLITDLQADKDTCSCFEVDSATLTLENGGNTQWRIGNISMPDGYFLYGKLIVNMIIPIPVSPQFALRRPISPMFPPPSIQTDSKNILPSDMHVAAPFPSGEDPGNPPTSELHRLFDKSSEQSSCHASSSICSTATQNAEISSKETCPLPVLQSTDQKKPANIEQSTKSEIEGRAAVQEPTLYLPSIRVGNISFPLKMTDPVWRLPNPAFCIGASPDSSMKVCNPFYVTRPAHTFQTMTSFGEKCNQQAPDLNHSNGLAFEESVTMLQMNGQPLDLDKITEHSIERENLEIDASLAAGTGNEFSVFSSSGNSIGRILTEEWKPNAFNTLPSDKTLGNYLMLDKTLAAISTDISLSGMQELSGMQSQPAFSTSASEKNDNPQSFSGSEEWQNINSGSEEWQSINSGSEEWQNINFGSEEWQKRNPHQINSTIQHVLKHFGFPDTTKLKRLLNMQSAQRLEGSEYPQSGNFGSAPVNERNKKNDPIPLYIDTLTTQKMEKLLKPDKHPSTSSPISTDATFPAQNSDANVNLFNSIYREDRRLR